MKSFDMHHDGVAGTAGAAESGRHKRRNSPKSAAAAEERVIVRNTAGQWLFPALLSGSTFLFFMYYHALRGKPFSLFTANKCAGITAVIVFSATLLIGPLDRLTGKFRRFLVYRRPLGLTAFVFLSAHAFASLFLLPEQFPLKYFREHLFSTVTGAASFILLAFAAAISNARSLRLLGYNRWKFLQSLSRPALALGLAHFVVLGKFANWLKWFRSPDYIYPPGTMLPFAAGVAALLVFVASLRRGRGAR